MERRYAFPGKTDACGVLVTGFNGGNCTIRRPDFSYGIEGFLVEKGQDGHPINEMVMTGNMISLWNQLQMAGDDIYIFSSRLLPSLLFDQGFGRIINNI